MSSANKIELKSLDALLGVTPTAQETEIDGEKVVRMPLHLLHTFHSHPQGHPFIVRDDEKMAETVESIKKHGVLIPGIVRPDRNGGYELVAGHRRKRGSELAGEKDMPVIIKNLTDDEATVLMVDTNIQREDLLPSEKAKAYRMKYDALKSMGVEEVGQRNDEILAKEMGESRCTIQRYIRLSYLTDDLLQMVDDKRLGKTAAADLSYLKTKEQVILFQFITETGSVPDGKQAAALKLQSLSEGVNLEVVMAIMENDVPTKKVTINQKKLRGFFPESYTAEEMENVIYMLLAEWKETVVNTL